MDVKELRIGNLVKDDECIIVVVEALSGDNALVNGYGENEVLFSKKGYPNVLFESEIYPIELTEELLLKCGFKKTDNNWVILDLQFMSFGWEKFARLTLSIDGNIMYLVHIKYVHQLQNLYFALTGEELVFTE